MIVHTDATCCGAHTGAHTHTRAVAMIIVFPEGMSLLGGHVFDCNILPVSLFFPFLRFSLPPPTLTCAQSGICLTCLFIFTPLPLLTLFLPVSLLLPSAFHPPPSGYPFHSGRYIQSLTRSEKPMEIDVCSVALSAVT